MQLKIDEEFRNLIPPMQADELSSLRESISREGCRDALIVWGGVLVDGHNRYAICTELGKPFNTKEITFADRDEVKIWIIRNQFARRNLNPMQRAELALRLEPLLKSQAEQGKRTDLSPKSAKSEKHDTREELAKAAGVSHDTIGKVKKIVNSPVKELARFTREGKVSINAAAKVAELPEKEQREAVEAGPEAVKDAAKCEPQKRCKPKARGKALEYGYKAIEILKSIPSDDGLHDEALSLVERWCAHNKKGN